MSDPKAPVCGKIKFFHRKTNEPFWLTAPFPNVSRELTLMLQSEQFKTESLSQSTASGVHMPIDCGRSAKQHFIAWKENMMEKETRHLKIDTDKYRQCYFPLSQMLLR